MNLVVSWVGLFVAMVMTAVLAGLLTGAFVDLGLAVAQIAGCALVIVGALVVAARAARAGDGR